MKQNALLSYLSAKELAEAFDHPDQRAHALFRLVDLSLELGNRDQARKYYDAFFPRHKGSFYEDEMRKLGVSLGRVPAIGD